MVIEISAFEKGQAAGRAQDRWTAADMRTFMAANSVS